MYCNVFQLCRFHSHLFTFHVDFFSLILEKSVHNERRTGYCRDNVIYCAYESYGRNKSYRFLTLQIIIVDILVFSLCANGIFDISSALHSHGVFSEKRINVVTFWNWANNSMWFVHWTENGIKSKRIRSWNEMQKKTFQTRTNAVVDVLNGIFMCWLHDVELFLSTSSHSYTFNDFIWFSMFHSTFWSRFHYNNRRTEAKNT